MLVKESFCVIARSTMIFDAFDWRRDAMPGIGSNALSPARKTGNAAPPVTILIPSIVFMPASCAAARTKVENR